MGYLFDDDNCLYTSSDKKQGYDIQKAMPSIAAQTAIAYATSFK